ncbi:hypothetical protein BO82DRAFT_48542 [Aspergillus uvarum CBS 121591]|uniref:Uncharacterized protein n=1 Tax=Aspergillus uvarum CBS 121591 TaxID=1448315 RepID=A0A319D501_9EURO|nr:hypothetical protein BO82DRAFT_48542 [Aspergillus uvarum CBS 121591]PYH82948.1 hypothetical protein BO82DRAFT_48542 [Aspergillus uvarum CBS 121591]
MVAVGSLNCALSRSLPGASQSRPTQASVGGLQVEPGGRTHQADKCQVIAGYQNSFHLVYSVGADELIKRKSK